ncbi:MAG: FxsA family protein [Geminicoccaceae bacterium]
MVLAALIIVPLIEIAVLIKVGGWIGVGPTLMLILLTAVLGTAMLRRQGFAVLRRAQGQLERGGIPVYEVFEGACLLIGGLLLVLPGFVTDGLGALLLLPPVRAALYRCLRRHIETPAVREPGGRAPDAPVIEGEFEEIGPDRPPPEDRGTPPPRGGWSRPR